MLCTNLNQNIMKINEASVIDNKVIDELISIYNVYLAKAIEDECSLVIINSIRVKLDVMDHFKSHLKPLEPIVRDAYFEEDCLNELTPADFNDYINETEI